MIAKKKIETIAIAAMMVVSIFAIFPLAIPSAQASPDPNLYVDNSLDLPSESAPPETGKLPTCYNLSAKDEWLYNSTSETLNLTAGNFSGFESGDAVEFLKENGALNCTSIIESIGADNATCSFTSETEPSDDITTGFANLVPMPEGSGSNSDDPFYTIQGAINAASAGDTINVAAGTYSTATNGETFPISVTKAVTIQSSGTAAETILDAGGQLGVTLQAAATLDGFTINNASNLAINIYDGTDGASAINNVINGAKIKIGNGCSNITVQGNTLTRESIYMGAGGASCSNITIKENTVSGCYTAGIDIYPGSDPYINVVIENNEITNCARGIAQSQGFISNITIKGNKVYNITTGPGVWVCDGSDITIENNEVYSCTHTNGHGVSISKGSGTITIQGNKVHENINGIFIGSGVTGVVTVNYNNIYGNTAYGLKNNRADVVDATCNWWGNPSGPSGVGYGTGDAVSANVDYDPWLDAAYPDGKPIKFTNATTETAPAGTTEIDAKAEADTNVSINTTAPVNVTIGNFSENPGTSFGGDIGKYIDVHINDTANVTNMTIKLFYTDVDIAGLNENTLGMQWWNGTTWTICSPHTGVNTIDQNEYSGYIWAYIDSGTKPNLTQLTGTPFGGSGSSAPTPSPTPTPPARGGGGGGGAPRDSDGDGIDDIDEMLAGTDKNDPCDPNPECAACLAIRPLTPTPTLPPTPTATPTVPPPVSPTPTPPTSPSPTPGFEAVFAIAGLLAVAYLVLRRKRK